MNSWAQGYVENFEYTHGFYRELTPSLLKFAALTNGRRLDFDLEGINYCELGCGQGFSTNLLAAANPRISFYANDFIPAHIVNARRLARAAKLENVRFYDHGFKDFQSEPSLPQEFDVIALHGVYSWVSREVRDEILSFIRAKLRPGGIVYISYNTLPGWSAVMPLRRLFVEQTETDPRGQSAAIEDAIQHAKVLEAASAGYFRGNSPASTILRKVSEMPKQYFAHEFLNQDWTPFYFRDLAAELSEAKLSFVGSVALLDSVDEISLTADQAALLQKETDEIRREGLRDFLVNQQFRTDMFARGTSTYTFKAGAGAWIETRLALSKSPSQITGTIKGRLQHIELNPPLLEQIVQALSVRPLTVRELLGEMMVPTNWNQFIQILAMLVGSQDVHPCLPEEGEQERIASCAVFNLAVCKFADDSDELQFLASPLTGGGIPMDRFEQLFLSAVRDGGTNADALSGFAWKILGPQGFRLSVEGAILETEEKNLAQLKIRAEAFLHGKLALLKLHKVV